jgi:hypothetical protein
MAFREVTVVQIREALRRWLRGEGERTIARAIGVDRKTARRYVAAAVRLGVDRTGGEGQLDCVPPRRPPPAAAGDQGTSPDLISEIPHP